MVIYYLSTDSVLLLYTQRKSSLKCNENINKRKQTKQKKNLLGRTTTNLGYLEVVRSKSLHDFCKWSLLVLRRAWDGTTLSRPLTRRGSKSIKDSGQCKFLHVGLRKLQATGQLSFLIMSFLYFLLQFCLSSTMNSLVTSASQQAWKTPG